MTKNQTIFSVICGRHRIGFAIFKDSRLIFYSIKSLSRFKIKKDVIKFVKSFLNRQISKYKINHLAIRNLNKSQKTSRILKYISETTKNTFETKSIKISTYDSAEIHRQLCESIDERPTKEMTAEFLVSKYPELRRYHQLKNDWQKRYYANLFQAIAQGLVCVKELDNNLQNKKSN
jgi:hypothetical protein